jgi:hypothetical protein
MTWTTTVMTDGSNGDVVKVFVMTLMTMGEGLVMT